MAEQVQGSRPIAITREIVLPLGVILALIGFAFEFGSSKASTERDVSTALALGQANAAAVVNLKEAQIRNEEKFGRYDDHLSQIDREYRLLRDYTEGRISQMPYRTTGGNQ
jgi:hypothetical protein